jgi:23S rRNA pseudouridine1911/1915/1917 synthase
MRNGDVGCGDDTIGAPPREGSQVKLIVPENFHGERLDQSLAMLLGQSRAFIQRVIEQDDVLLNGKPAKKSAALCEGDEIICSFAEPVELAAKPENIALDVRYEDDDLLVVNKPKGMVVHPAPGHAEHTLVNALLYHCKGQLSGINGVIRPGIVHRIDKDTSGLLIVAKNDFAHHFLAEGIHGFVREYRAVVHGVLKKESGTIDAPIGRCVRDRKRMAVLKTGKPARTQYELIAQHDKFAELRLRLETGRTHQIRVHMAHANHPVAGDAVYGAADKRLDGQCLHAARLVFTHPRTGKEIDLQTELPEYYENFLRKIQGGLS